MRPARIRKILLLDDDRIQKILVEKRIFKTNSGIGFVYFETSRQALSFLKAEPVDLLLVDLDLPEMSGWDYVDEPESPTGFKGDFVVGTG